MALSIKTLTQTTRSFLPAVTSMLAVSLGTLPSGALAAKASSGSVMSSHKHQRADMRACSPAEIEYMGDAMDFMMYNGWTKDNPQHYITLAAMLVCVKEGDTLAGNIHPAHIVGFGVGTTSPSIFKPLMPQCSIGASHNPKEINLALRTHIAKVCNDPYANPCIPVSQSDCAKYLGLMEQETTVVESSGSGASSAHLMPRGRGPGIVTQGSDSSTTSLRRGSRA